MLPSSSAQGAFSHAKSQERASRQSEVVDNAPLTVAERNRFKECERVIEIGLHAFVEVGNALLEIRQLRFYRSEYSTFEAYCRERWRLKRQRAYELMEAAEVVVSLSKSLKDIPAQKLPQKEAHAAQLSKAPPEERPLIWKQVVSDTESTAQHITAKKIADTINKRFELARTDVIPLRSFAEPIKNEEEDLLDEPLDVALGKVKKALSNASPKEIMLQVSGRWLIRNDLVETWKRLRQMSNHLIITDEYKDYVTLDQARLLGLIS